MVATTFHLGEFSTLVRVRAEIFPNRFYPRPLYISIRKSSRAHPSSFPLEYTHVFALHVQAFTAQLKWLGTVGAKLITGRT